MVRGAISFYGKGKLEGISTSLDSKGYVEILRDTLLLFAAEIAT